MSSPAAPLGIVVMAATSLVLPVWADAPADPALHLDRAQALYGELRYAEVVPELEKALAAPSVNDQQRIEIYALMGKVQVVLGDTQSGRRSFDQLLELDPTFQLEQDLSPKILGVFEEARKAHPPPVSPQPEPEPQIEPEGAAPTPEPTPPSQDQAPPENFGTGFWIAVGVATVAAALVVTVAVAMSLKMASPTSS